MTFPNLFSPVKIGRLDLRNRLIMSLYPTKYPQDGQVNDRYIEFWRARAKGGVAMIVLDGACLDYPAAYKGGPELRMDTPEHAAGLKRLLDAVQGEGARAFMHLNFPAGLPCSAGKPGAVEKKGKWVLPLAAAAAAPELARIVELFGAGAARAREIGYDGVEVQASWGDLVAQFLSPLTNKRTDTYGGALKNRQRFLLEIVREIKRQAGSEYPVQIKLVVDELMPGGFDLSDGESTAIELEAAGADSILVNVGNKKTKKHTIPPHSLPHGVSISYAEAIKSVVDIPVIAMGKINGPALAERALAAGEADLIAMTRALIADPDLPNKAAAGRVDDIRGCIYCLDDCADKGVPGLGRACVNNPLAGLEYELKIVSALRKRRVWVIGGGPAGMQAALTSAERGHDVTLFERQGHWGGQFRLAPMSPYKAEVSEVLRWLELQLSRSSVDSKLNHQVGLGEILAAKPDVVVVATGSDSRVPVLRGIDQPSVIDARVFLEKHVKPGRNVVVIGGGDIGCEMAELAADQGSRVTVLELLGEVLPKTKSIPRSDLLDRLRKKDVRILTKTAAERIEVDRVLAIGDDGREIELAVQTVIYAVGAVSNHRLYDELRNKVGEVYLVGDASAPANLGQALRSAFKVAATI